MTGRDLVTASLRLIGAIAPGESVSASEATDGLASVNRMLDSWSTEGLSVFQITAENPITLTPGDPTYTLGSGGDLTIRPMRIEQAFIRDGSIDFPLKLLSLSEFTSIANKGVQASIPSSLYDDGGYPTRTVTLYPVPLSAKSLYLFTKRPLTNISTIDTVLSFPPGYEEAIAYNAAVRLSPEYGRAVSQEVATIAMESRANIKRANQRSYYLRCDDALVGRGKFDINTGDFRQ